MKLLLLALVGLMPLNTECATSRFKRWSASPGCSSCSSGYSYSAPSYSCSYCGSSGYVATAPACGGNCYSSGGGGGGGCAGGGGGGRGGGRRRSYNKGRRAGRRAR